MNSAMLVLYFVDRDKFLSSYQLSIVFLSTFCTRMSRVFHDKEIRQICQI